MLLFDIKCIFIYNNSCQCPMLEGNSVVSARLLTYLAKVRPPGPQSNLVFFPPMQKTALTKESGNPGERVVYLVEQKTWLCRGT